jgi:hypothetical protein
MTKDFVTIATFSDPTPAHFFRALLESEGFHVFIKGEHVASLGFGMFGGALGAQLQVPADQADAALETLTRLQEMAERGELAIPDDIPEEALEEADDEALAADAWDEEEDDEPSFEEQAEAETFDDGDSPRIETPPYAPPGREPAQPGSPRPQPVREPPTGGIFMLAGPVFVTLLVLLVAAGLAVLIWRWL